MESRRCLHSTGLDIKKKKIRAQQQRKFGISGNIEIQFM